MSTEVAFLLNGSAIFYYFLLFLVQDERPCIFLCYGQEYYSDYRRSFAYNSSLIEIWFWYGQISCNSSICCSYVNMGYSAGWFYPHWPTSVVPSISKVGVLLCYFFLDWSHSISSLALSWGIQRFFFFFLFISYLIFECIINLPQIADGSLFATFLIRSLSVSF